MTPTLTPEPVLPGDVDGNGLVETTDAIILLRCIMGLLDEASVPGIMNGDMNADGELTTNDVLMILRTAIGMS